MIDWTQPIETTETPPKPEPVLREAWVSLYEDGCCYANLQEVNASGNGRVECRHIVWMSDGSPVPGEDDYVGMTGKIAMLEKQLDRLRQEHEKAEMRIANMKTEFHDSLEWDELVAERDSLKAALEIARTQRDDASAALDRMTAERDSLKAELATFYCSCGQSLLTGHHEEGCPHDKPVSDWRDDERQRLRESRNNIKAERDNALADFRHSMELVRSYAAKIERLEKELEALSKYGLIVAQREDIARMRPVVDAAIVWERHFTQLAADRLVVAVRAYQSTPKKTAEEAVANVAAMMGPVKTCNNCKHNGPTHCVSWSMCPSFQAWEAKND